MHTAAIIILILVFLELCCALAFHGKSKGNWNAGATLFNEALIVGLLYWGGFFSNA